jgi:DNA (cytosine-5)-methyltransferase 1
MTVMEARRAQGFPDHEVLLGAPVEQWKLIGKSVARMALALGLSFRDAWLGTLYDEPHLILAVADEAGRETSGRHETPMPKDSTMAIREPSTCLLTPASTASSGSTVAARSQNLNAIRTQSRVGLSVGSLQSTAAPQASSRVVVELKRIATAAKTQTSHQPVERVLLGTTRIICQLRRGGLQRRNNGTISI